MLEAGSVVVSYFLMRESQREKIMSMFNPAKFVYLDVPKEILFERLGSRGEHFFKAQTLEKLIAVVEPITLKHYRVDGSKPEHEVVEEIAKIASS